MRTDRQFMLFENSEMSEVLRKIVHGITTDAALQQDMFQECLVCLWRVERDIPGRTRSWYLQNCRFHAQHWLAIGRSLDSPKRGAGDNRITIDGTDNEAALAEYHTDGELFQAVSAQDIVSTLERHLNPREGVVLRGLADGLILREIASKFNLSYPTALKYRRKIASLAIKLGIAAPHKANNRNAIERRRPIGSCPMTSSQRKLESNTAMRSAHSLREEASGRSPAGGGVMISKGSDRRKRRAEIKSSFRFAVRELEGRQLPVSPPACDATAFVTTAKAPLAATVDQPSGW